MSAMERIYFDTLKRIAKDYQSPDKIRRICEKEWGLDYVESLEMAYQNIQAEAAAVIKGRRAPKLA